MLSPETCELIEDAFGFLLIFWTAAVIYFCLFMQYFARWQRVSVLVTSGLLLVGSFFVQAVPPLHSCMGELEWVILFYRATFVWLLFWGIRYLWV
ncbi:hypothetical protein [Candidatus Methylacidithermus pantelleriae]|uniref:Uncharacterized protein n=1 Tax=Candidatus Methylacidithermus pantelleriae TaxID=2744239 RepID=A0A8J2BUM7_9BACT|nr:hypothetical protein [Candidatus Methylacidithermus pantelleriae]CAF0702036.1 membrane hypothetical protein [Candidatus Methylacidithermus pantelleriae]